jgi:hypothetical protein
VGSAPAQRRPGRRFDLLAAQVNGLDGSHAGADLEAGRLTLVQPFKVWQQRLRHRFQPDDRTDLIGVEPGEAGRRGIAVGPVVLEVDDGRSAAELGASSGSSAP